LDDLKEEVEDVRREDGRVERQYARGPALTVEESNEVVEIVDKERAKEVQV
jgi:hypothetical protein